MSSHYLTAPSPWDLNPSESLVRTALLSARLYADAQMNPLLTYRGWGTMPILDAVQVLIQDGIRDKLGAERAVTRWPTRLRVAGALGNLAYGNLDGASLAARR